MDKIDKLKNFIKSMPFMGKIALRIYSIFNFIKPGGQYWEFDFKAKKIDRLIRNIASLIGDKGYEVVINNEGNVYIILKNGIKFYWIPRDPYSLLGMPLQGSFEPECTFLLAKLIKKGDVVFDIGANFGWYSCHFAQLVGETGKVHVFEPTNAIEELKNNLILNGFEARCILNKVALGAKKGIDTLFIPKKLGTAFASLREHSYSDSGKSRKISVHIEKLDEYILSNKIEKIDFIKMDVEGAEYLVLKGAENVLKQYSPVIMLELYDGHIKCFGYSQGELINYLGGFGYHLYEINEKEKEFGSLRKVNSFSDTNNYNFLALKNADILKPKGISII